MKSIKLVAMAAMITSAMVPITIATPAYAAVPTTWDMQSVCNALITGMDAQTYHVILTAGSVDQGAVERVPGSWTQDVNPHPDLTAIPTPVGAFSFEGSVGKIGQSPNLFSKIYYSQASYPKLVDVQEDQQRIDTYNFSCQVQHYEVVGQHEEGDPEVPAVPAEGYYTNPQENSHGDCHGISPTNPHWGEDIGACEWTETKPGEPAIPATTHMVDDWGWVDVDGAALESLTDTVHLGWATILTDDPRPLEAPIVVGGYYPAGTVVVCNSPGSKGGAWRAQNGYGGANCNTTYYKALTTQWLSGVEDRFHAFSTMPL